MIKKGLLIALCGFATVGVCGSMAVQSAEDTLNGVQNVSQDKLKDLDEIIHKALETFKVPGGAVGVVVNGQIVLSKGYGVRDRAQNLPVTENTLFAIGSCTKAFTTFVLGQLVDEGVIAWDDPVIQYLPEFRLKDQHATHHLTIRDLVTHRSGMPRHDFVWYNAEFSRNELLTRLQYLEFSSDLREKFQYNNLMYGVAGLVIEKVTGQAWEEALQARILAPLQMNRSNFSVEDSQRSEDFAFPYQETEGQVERILFRKITNIGPAGSINSSVADMVKWLQLQLSGGIFAEKTLIQKTTLQEMHSLQMPIPTYPTESIYSFGYGLGWMIGVHQGHYCASHRGSIDGFVSSVALLPRDGIGVVVLSNKSPDGFAFVTAVTNAVLDRLIEATEVDWVAKLAEQNSKMKEATQKTIDENPNLEKPFSAFDQYVGEYEHPAYGIVKMYLKEDALFAECNQISYPLKHHSYDAFTGALPIVSIDSLPFQFSRTASGEVSEVRIPFEPAVEAVAFKKMPSHELLAFDYLKRFLGTFERAGTLLEVRLKGNQLSCIVADQSIVDLVAIKPLSFALKGLPGRTAEFVTDARGAISEVLLTSPYGKVSFKAKESKE